MMNENLKWELDCVTKSHGIKNCEWELTDYMFIGEYYTVVTLESGFMYRIFIGENLICFQYIDEESGDVVDIYCNENENDVAHKLSELLTEYNNAIWEVYGDTNSLNYWYKCKK